MDKKTKKESLEEQLLIIAQEHNINPDELKAIMEAAKYHAAAPSFDLSKYVKDGKVRFGVISDTKLNSKWMRPDIYRSLYNNFKQEGVSYVFHCGDITDGYMRYTTHFDDQIFKNYEQMLEVLLNPKEQIGYPKIGVDTYFIGGNCDRSYFKRVNQKVRTNVCMDIASKREDLIFAGWNVGNFKIADKTTVRLSHPRTGSKKPYTISHPVQKKVFALGAGQKPDILISGYFQKRFHFRARGIDVHMVGSAISQTPIDAENDISAPSIGGVMFEVHFKKDGSLDLENLVVEDFPFYD